MRATEPSSRPARIHPGNGRTRAQHVVALPGDFFQHAHAAPAEQVQIDCQAPVHHADQRQTFQEKVARLRGNFAHHGREGGREAPREELFQRVAVPFA